MKKSVSTNIEIDHDAPEPLPLQICSGLRNLILSGALPAGARMSSTRRTALELGVSRNSVMAAHAMLIAEGYLETRIGDGTFVTADAALQPQPIAASASIPPFDYRPYRFDAIDFRAGIPDLRRFPVSIWKRLSRGVWDGSAPLDLTYGQPEGRIELRRGIAAYLAAYRGVRCHPDQILVTSGATQALGIVGRLLLRGDRKVCLLEDPAASDSQRILNDLGARIEPVPVDEQGLVTDELPAVAQPALIFVSPSHQYPLGVTMPLARRARLLEFARRAGAYVVENDHDGVFRYDSPPIGSIQGMDPARVVHIGSFSTTLFPSLRIGYAVLPPELVLLGREGKWLADVHAPVIDQLILARFMEEGSFDRYRRSMSRRYGRTRELLVDALARNFGAGVQVLGNAAGLHLCARFPGIKFTFKILNRISLAGVGVYPVEEHALRKGRWEDALVLGYGMLDARSINVGIAILKRCVPPQ
jgi:GntR family transcriptional regulator/MocR family aminotransferase